MLSLDGRLVAFLYDDNDVAQKTPYFNSMVEIHIFGQTSLMRIISLLSALLIILVFAIGSCSKSPVPEPTPVTTPMLTASVVVTAVTGTTAISGGNITSDGGAPITSRGVCWNTSTTPTVSNFKTMDGEGLGAFTSTLTGLTQGTVYYLRAYATNSKGTTYAPEVSFTTRVTTVLPTLATTSVATTVTSNSAISGGDISSDGGAAVTSRGVCWSTSPNPTTANFKTIDGTGTGVFTSNLTGLNPTTLYYVRAYATNSIGTSYASEISFTTNAVMVIPTLASTTSPTLITTNTAISGGNILSDGGANVTSRGVCWSTSPGPTTTNSKTLDGGGTGIFASNITGLIENTIYYARAYATNSSGTGYGSEISFTSSPSGAVTICSQVWMNRNLSVSTYRNGDPIPLVTDNATWQTLTTGAYSYHNNDPASEAIYGKLYNWYAVNDPRGLAPAGWHVPTGSEWTTMSTCLGGSVNAGGPLKEAGTARWASPNSGATNITGFTALPGGWRANTGTYSSVPGTVANWWTSTQVNVTDAAGRTVRYDNANINPTSYVKVGGFSVRCVKD